MILLYTKTSLQATLHNHLAAHVNARTSKQVMRRLLASASLKVLWWAHAIEYITQVLQCRIYPEFGICHDLGQIDPVTFWWALGLLEELHQDHYQIS
eukprot:560331-Amphidinium_carterae.2